MKQIAVKGLDKLVRQFEAFGEDAKKMATAELEDGAREIAEVAKKNAPANIGKLRQGIQFVRVNPLRFEVISNESYSGYVEFGTGQKVFIPADMKEVAQAIKNNPKQDRGNALESIRDWCRQKGIDERAAWPILMSILDEGLRPRPFMFPAFVTGSKNTFKRLEKELDRQVRRFNSQR